MTLFKNDDTLEIIYKLFQACSYFFHQNKTEITSTLNDSETTVPSNKAVSDGLTAKVDKNNIVQTIDSSNSSALDKVPSCAAVSTALSGKLDNSSKASGINTDNKSDDDSVTGAFVNEASLSVHGENQPEGEPGSSEMDDEYTDTAVFVLGGLKTSSVKTISHKWLRIALP